MVEYYRQFPDGKALEVLYVEGLLAWSSNQNSI
jgi:hypothetical protein